MSNVFNEMGAYWAEIADKNHTQPQINLIKTLLTPGAGAVLDLACGHGRHLIPLQEAGYNVVGVDASLKLLRISISRGAKDVVQADLRFLPFRSGCFCAVVSVDTSFGYTDTQAGDMQILDEANRVLAIRGKLLIDVFNIQKLALKYQNKAVEPKTYRYAGFVLEQKRTLTSDGATLRDEWKVLDAAKNQTVQFNHQVRLYTEKQLAHMLKQAGFEIEKTAGNYTLEPLNSTMPRLIVFAAKTAGLGCGCSKTG